MTTKKRTTPKESPAPSPVEWYTVGTGFTKRQLYRLNGPLCPEHQPIIKELSERHSSGRNAFDRAIAATEAAARQILKEVGLPLEPMLCYTIPDGEQVLSLEPIPGTGRLPELVAAKGYRERVDQVWYAAEILDLARTIREIVMYSTLKVPSLENIAGRKEPWTALSLAATLGELVGEAKALGFFGRAGGKNRGKKKTLPPVAALVRSLIRKNRQGTVTDLWDMIPTDQLNSIKILGYKFFRSGGRLLALGKVDGYKDWRPVGRPLKKRSFEKRVTQVRKPRTR